MNAEQKCQLFYRMCHQGGNFGMWWTPQGGRNGEKKYSSYVPVGQTFLPPASWLSKHLYFGINPTSIQREYYQAMRMPDMCVSNCFFAEYDGPVAVTPNLFEVQMYYYELRNDPKRAKVSDDLLLRQARLKASKQEFGRNRKYYKYLLLQHIQRLPILPTVLIDSGGGYQGYWFLDEPVDISTEDKRAAFGALQRRWVLADHMADPLFDVRRVFRGPLARGDEYITYNRKPHYGPDFPAVTIMWSNWDDRHKLSTLESALPPALVEEKKTGLVVPERYLGEEHGDGQVIDEYNRRVTIKHELLSWGYTESHMRMSRAGEEDSAGVVIHEADNVSVHFSTMDELYAMKASGTPYAWTPFGVRCKLGFKDNVKEAVRAVALEMGMGYRRREIVMPENITPQERSEAVIEFLLGGKR